MDRSGSGGRRGCTPGPAARSAAGSRRRGEPWTGCGRRLQRRSNAWASAWAEGFRQAEACVQGRANSSHPMGKGEDSNSNVPFAAGAMVYGCWLACAEPACKKASTRAMVYYGFPQAANKTTQVQSYSNGRAVLRLASGLGFTRFQVDSTPGEWGEV